LFLGVHRLEKLPEIRDSFNPNAPSFSYLIKLTAVILDYENDANPFDEVRARIKAWKKLAYANCTLTSQISIKAREYMALGLRQMDASHLACAAYMRADYFLTTDKKILNKHITEICIINPVDFARRFINAQ
jgi:predicted nucleic acid-binding protein